MRYLFGHFFTLKKEKFILSRDTIFEGQVFPFGEDSKILKPHNDLGVDFWTKAPL